jgi:F0F1-type ATP synthase membrane subunit c/vacuolar-type H+-ATPase subunit K
MTRFLKMLLAALAFGLALLASAAAQAPAGLACGKHDEVVAQLGKLFGERRLGQGLADGGFIIELFVSPQGSFTVFATTPRGRSCLIASGEAWEPPPQEESFAAR